MESLFAILKIVAAHAPDKGYFLLLAILILSLCYFYLNSPILGGRDISERISDRNLITRSRLKTIFRTHPLSPHIPIGQHTHPQSATERNSMATTFTTLAMAAGLRPYMYQMSLSDQRKGLMGCRDYFWAKDVTVPARPRKDYPIGDRDLVCMVDVDYYVDMPKFLLENVHPTVLYTIEPTAPSGSTHNAHFFFSKNEMKMNVAGGGSFQHRLWDYGTDTLKFTGPILGLGGRTVVYRTVVYAVERRPVSAHRTIVLLVPTLHVDFTPCQFFAQPKLVAGIRNLSGGSLKYLSPLSKSGKFNVLSTLNVDGSVWITISPDGNQASFSIPLIVDTALRAVALAARNKKQGLTAASVESYLPKDMPDRSIGAQVLRVYYAESYGDIAPEHYVYPVVDSVSRYQCSAKVDDSAKPSLTPFMAPLLGPVPSADLCVANDVKCVEERITNVRTPEKPITSFMAQAIRAFANELIPDNMAGKAAPYSDDEVYERQKRRTQQQILANSDLEGSLFKRVVKSFQKREAYGGFKDPRNISTIAGKDKCAYSCYTYALADLIKDQPWYAFSKTPVEISTRVADVCSKCDSVFLGDFSRMDGRVSNVGRLLTTTVAMRYFHPSHHSDLDALLRSQTGLSAVTRFGVRYSTGTSRLSGSPETSLFNTMETAFIIYLCYRSQMKSGLRVSHDEAWDKLLNIAVAGGDDSAAGDITPEEFSRAAAMVGHKATGEVVKRGDAGINFLSRYYSPQVWYGVADSCSDIQRAVLKFHTASNLAQGTSAVDKLVEKSLAVFCTDRNTPLLGEFCGKVLEFKSTTKATGDTSWWAQYDTEKEQFPNSNLDNWMDDLLVKQLPEYDIDGFRKWLDDAKTVEDLLRVPQCGPSDAQPPPKFDAVINGVVHSGCATPVTEIEKPVAKSKSKSRGKRGKKTLPPVK